MDRGLLFVGALLGLLGVGIGAFGAHALQDLLVEHQREDVYQTATLYHLVHALAVLAAGIVPTRLDRRAVRLAGWLFAAGVVLFSGSLYALAITNIEGLGMITPFGGVAFLLGWLSLGVGAVQGPRSSGD